MRPDDRSTADGNILDSDLPNLGELRLADLERVPPSALLESVRRILAQSGKEPTAYQQYMANI